MTLVIPNNFCEAAIELRNSGDPNPWYVTMGIDLTNAGGDYAAAGAQINTAWNNAWQGSLRPSTTHTGVRLTIGTGDPDNLVLFIADGTTGTSSDEKLPQNCALLVSKNTAFGGRKNRGRFFIPNILAESSVNEVGVIGSSTVANYQTFADNFLTDISGSGDAGDLNIPMVILHNGIASTAPDPTLVSSLSVSNVISTQRRRLR